MSVCRQVCIFLANYKWLQQPAGNHSNDKKVQFLVQWFPLATIRWGILTFSLATRSCQEVADWSLGLWLWGLSEISAFMSYLLCTISPPPFHFISTFQLGLSTCFSWFYPSWKTHIKEYELKPKDIVSIMFFSHIRATLITKLTIAVHTQQTFKPSILYDMNAVKAHTSAPHFCF